MAIAPPFPHPAAPSAKTAWQRLAFGDSIWRAPLVPAALALTVGILLDRYVEVPLPFSLAGVLVGLAAWVVTRLDRQPGLSLLYLAGAVAAFGAAYHHWQRNHFAPDDIGVFATATPRPVKARGVIAEEPGVSRRPKNDPLQSFERPDPTVAVLEVSHLQERHDWRPVTGRARLVVTGELSGIHVGDEVEVVGRLIKPQPPANPGEFDYASFLQDQRIRAIIGVAKTPDGVTRLVEGRAWSPARALPLVRGWSQNTLNEAISPEYSGLAVALLLGDGSQMTGRDWEKYINTGVIHVLAISGQHLVVLAGFLWMAVRVLGVRRRRGAIFVGLFLLGYSLLAGGRPPVMRSAVMVCVLCLGLILRRPVLPANSFALGWIVVALLNPTDLFGSGCQLSFLAVAVLYWGTNRWFRSDPDPLERLIDAARPNWLRGLRWLGGVVASSYLTTLVIWLAAAPLVAAKYHTVPVVGLLIGPPEILLTSVALLAGFLLLFLSVLCWPLVPAAARITEYSLAGCEALVDLGQGLRWGSWYVGDIPDWWLWVYYPSFLAVLLLPSLRQRWHWAAVAGLAWLCVGLLSGWTRPASEELRCTFLAVGHGGCTVLEAPDGRTLLYDAGAINGPDVTKRQIAPFLWSRGVRRLDEVFLSHADLDHFNGLVDLANRFAIGQVTCTPTYAQKSTKAVHITLATLKRRGIPVRIVRAGDRLSAGDVTIDVLHPPANGPEGNENARSMVLLVRHARHSLLLTGDLEGAGMQRVLDLPLPRVDVLMAPHHGSLRTDTPGLAKKVCPRLVVSCQGPPRGATRPKAPELPPGIPYWGTWPHGAVIVRSGRGGLVVETFLTGQRLQFPSK